MKNPTNILLAALRQIAAAAPSEKPSIEFPGATDGYELGHEVASWEAGEIARAALKAMPKGKSKVWFIPVKVTVNNPITYAEAKYTVWNQGQVDLYGDGKPDRFQRAIGERYREPYDTGKITARP